MGVAGLLARDESALASNDKLCIEPGDSVPLP